MSFRKILFATLFLVFPLIIFATDHYKAISDVNVRSGPGKKYPIVFVLRQGEQVEVLAKKEDWVLLNYLGKIGHANSKYLALVNSVISNDAPKTKQTSHTDFQSILYWVALIAVIIAIWWFKRWQFEKGRIQRRDYYRNVYLKSDEWQRKRFVVLKRDNWRCVYCGAQATQVHHKRYAKYNIGNEPISWLVSVCKTCHEVQHS